MNSNPNWFKRLFFALGRFLNISRKIIINFVFFTFLIIFIIAIGKGEDVVKVPDGAALVLNLQGDVVEQKHEIDPIDAFMQEALKQQDENPEVLLSDVLNVIENAKTDDRISILVLHLQDMNRIGFSKLQNIGNALLDFKDSGKSIIAIGDNFTQSQYYLASYSNEIWLNPKGWMMLDGFGRYSMYFKSAIEKLSISQHIFRVGTFKSAVEPYIRDDMSEEAKEANKLWLNDLWIQYKTDVATLRGFDINNFDESIDVLVEKFQAVDGSYANYAQTNGWVDTLKTRDEMRQALIEIVGEDDESYKQIGFKQYLTAINASVIPNITTKDQVAVIVAKGVILDGNQAPGTIGGDSTARLLREARDNENVKAVVLRVDSPGGSAYASEIIRQEVVELKKAGKPVVASMGTYAASGGYWISASADKIIASPSTITGSIGIFGMFMTFENTLSKLGIFTDGVGTTDLAGFGITRPLSEGMAEIIQLSINRGYHDFITLVAENRNMTLEQVDKVAQGRVWSGIRAKEIGLVDELGNIDDAIAIAADLAQLSDYEKILIQQKPDATDIFLQNLLGSNAQLLPSVSKTVGPLDQFIAQFKAEIATLNQFNDPQGIYSFCVSCEIN